MSFAIRAGGKEKAEEDYRENPVFFEATDSRHKNSAPMIFMENCKLMHGHSTDGKDRHTATQLMSYRLF